MTVSAVGAQRLSLEVLQRWQRLEYGMFVHFGMSTYDGYEFSWGDRPATTYAPDRLDVRQWVAVARDSGMRYAVLTAKHVAGHCLWPSRLTDYTVEHSTDTTDVVGEFVTACQDMGVVPGLYYCSWDNHHTFGPPVWDGRGLAPPTQDYVDFQVEHMRELLSSYDGIGEVWVDIPGQLGEVGRRRVYDLCHELQPEAVVVMNTGFTDGSKPLWLGWPTDVVTAERQLPEWMTRSPWRDRLDSGGLGEWFYAPTEMCDVINGPQWFYADDDPARPREELLAMRLAARAAGANLLLNVPPDRSGRIPAGYVVALDQLRKDVDGLGLAPLPTPPASPPDEHPLAFLNA